MPNSRDEHWAQRRAEGGGQFLEVRRRVGPKARKAGREAGLMTLEPLPPSGKQGARESSPSVGRARVASPRTGRAIPSCQHRETCSADASDVDMFEQVTAVCSVSGIHLRFHWRTRFWSTTRGAHCAQHQRLSPLWAVRGSALSDPKGSVTELPPVQTLATRVALLRGVLAGRRRSRSMAAGYFLASNSTV